MNLTMHWMRKDLGRLRYLLLGWAGALVFQYAWEGIYLFCGDSVNAMTCKGFAVLGACAVWILGVLMTGMAVLNDPLTGFSPFWLGRPVSKYQLLCSKLGTVLLLASVPVLFYVGLLGCVGLGLGALLAGAAHGLMLNLGVLLAAALLAALSHSFGGFTLRVVLVLIASSFLWLVCGSLVRSVTWFKADNMPVEPSLLDSKSLVFWLGLLVLSLIFLVLRYGVRHSKNVAALPYLGLVLLVSGSCLWPWDFVGALRFSQTPDPEAERPVFDLGSRQLELDISRTSLTSLEAVLRVVRGRAGEFVVPRALYGVNLRGSGEGAPSLRTVQAMRFPRTLSEDPLWDPAALTACVDGLKVLNPTAVPELRLMACYLRESELAKVPEGGVVIRAGVSAMRLRYRIHAELPLAEKAEACRDGVRIRIETLNTSGVQPVIRLREDRFVSGLVAECNASRPNPFTLGRSAVDPFLQWPMLYVLVNRVRGEALVVGRSRLGRTLELGELRLGVRTLQPSWEPTMNPGARADWLEKASLVCIALEELGPVQGKVKEQTVEFKK